MERAGTQSLQGRRVFVSGGTTGIGRALVDKLVEAGARVATFGREVGPIEELKRAQPDVLVLQGDLSNEADVRRILDETVRTLGGIDDLVNNAAVAGDSITMSAYPEWRQVIEINLIGPMLLTQVALDHLREGSHIVTVGSMSAKVREAESDVYVATKSGIRGFVDSVAKLLSPKGIALTLVEPGLAESDMTTEDKSEAETQKKKADEEMMDPEDVARMIVFTLSQPAHISVGLLQIRPRAQLI